MRLRRPDRLRLLPGRKGLAGEHRLVALELVGREHAEVGRDDVADADPDDGARDELGRVDGDARPVTQRQRRVAEPGMQRLDRTLGAVLVEEAEADAEAADQEDDQGVRSLPHEGRGERGGEEKEQERVAQLPAENGERAGAMAAQRVRADRAQPPPRLLRGKPALARAEHVQDLGRRQACGGREIEVLHTGGPLDSAVHVAIVSGPRRGSRPAAGFTLVSCRS